MTSETFAAIHEHTGCGYPSDPPFHPAVAYPEYELGNECLSNLSNPVYEGVRQLFQLLHLDVEAFGTASWNPLGGLVRPGDRVVLKPNCVLHFNAAGFGLDEVVTHGSVVRAVLDYVLKALQGSGEVIVGDAPHGNCDFEKVVHHTGLRRVVDFYAVRGINIRLVDFRTYRYGPGADGFLRETRTELGGDPNGYRVVDLGRDSELADLDSLERLYGADWDRSVIRKHHNASRHEYLISGSVLKADVVISVPKMKVHSKAGVTINLKNLVGINGDKNWLPHYRVGHRRDGGDEYPQSPLTAENALRTFDRFLQDHLPAFDSRLTKWTYLASSKASNTLLRLLWRRTRNEIVRGNWSGNDTTWRMVLDLNRILLYADQNGKMRDTRQRRFLSVVDGIVSGEGQGPLGPSPRPVGILIAGFNPLLVDLVGAKLMGFEPDALPLFANAYRSCSRPISQHRFQEIDVRSNQSKYERLLWSPAPHLNFKRPIGWLEDKAC